VVAATGKEVELLKLNVQDNPEIAAALRIQSVPTVYAFLGGRPVDGFQGALPESQVKAFVERIAASAAQTRDGMLDIPEALKAAAEALAQGDLATAHALYSRILGQDEKNADGYAGLIRTLVATEQIDDAAYLIENAPEDIAKSAVFAAAKTALELAQAGPSGPVDELAEKVRQNPGDQQARLDLAQAQFSAGDKEGAIETLLEAIAVDREWNEQAARLQLLKFFEALGHSDPLTVQGRKKLSTLLFS
jgi:putative thioredoxin